MQGDERLAAQCDQFLAPRAWLALGLRELASSRYPENGGSL
jgi:hypothetical protein